MANEGGRAHKIIITVLFAASTHPDSEIRELPRGSLLEGLERPVPSRPPGRRTRGQGGRGESDCAGGED